MYTLMEYGAFANAIRLHAAGIAVLEADSSPLTGLFPTKK